MKEHARRLQVEPASVTVQDLGYRWDFCGKGNRIYFHWKTILLPRHIAEYVVVHELVHLMEPHHPLAFWRLMERVMPDFERRKEWLARHGIEVVGFDFSHKVQHIVRNRTGGCPMNWSYEYLADEAIHRPTQLTFSVSYDPVRPEQKITLSSEKPESISDAEVESLKKELEALIQEQHQQRRMSYLLYGAFCGEFSRAAYILEQETKKKVSTRTLQAWMMPPGRPSSRRCPEWAVAALEEYVESHPDQVKWLKEAVEDSHRTQKGRAIEHQRALRDRELLRNAESRLASIDATRQKWKGTSLEELTSNLANLETSVQDQIDANSMFRDRLMHTLRGCENFEDFKRTILEQEESFALSEHLLKETARDIQERRKEFASDDGTCLTQGR